MAAAQKVPDFHARHVGSVLGATVTSSHVLPKVCGYSGEKVQGLNAESYHGLDQRGPAQGVCLAVLACGSEGAGLQRAVHQLQALGHGEDP